MSPSVSGGETPLTLLTPAKFAIGIGIWFLGAPCWTSALPWCRSGIFTLSPRQWSVTFLNIVFQWPGLGCMSRTARVRTPCATWTLGTAEELEREACETGAPAATARRIVSFDDLL